MRRLEASEARKDDEETEEDLELSLECAERFARRDFLSLPNRLELGAEGGEAWGVSVVCVENRSLNSIATLLRLLCSCSASS